MIEEEQPQHDSDNHTEDEHHEEVLMLELQVLEHNHEGGLKPLALRIDIHLVVQVTLVDEVPQDLVPDDAAVRADDGMEEEECQEVPIVVESYAAVDPDAVVVKLLDASPAHAAVLRAGWLVEVTGAT